MSTIIVVQARTSRTTWQEMRRFEADNAEAYTKAMQEARAFARNIINADSGVEVMIEQL